MSRSGNNELRLDDEPEQDNNEIDLSEDDEDHFNFSHESFEEEPFHEQQTLKSQRQGKHKLSVIPENNNENNSMVLPTAKNLLPSSVVPNTGHAPIMPTVQDTIQATVPSTRTAFDTTSVFVGKSTLDSSMASSGRNVLNSISFSSIKLAEIDAKYQFCQNSINRMDIKEIMASMNLTGKSRYHKDAPTTTKSTRTTTTNENAFKVNKPSVVDTLLQAKKNGTFKREPFANRLALENSLINEEIGINFEGKHAPQTGLKTTRSASTVASQNTSVASDQVFSRSSIISVDKPVMAFGFVAYKTSRSLSVKISNDSDESLWLQPSIVHSTTTAPNNQAPQDIFRLNDTSSFSLDPHSSHNICVVFEPKKALTYNAQLRLRLMSKDEPEFLIRMFGYGARAELELRTQNFDKVEMGSDGVGIFEIDRSTKQAQLILTNKGQRDAFTHIIAVDANNQPLSGDVVKVEPSRVVVQKNTKEYAKISVTFRYGVGSTTMIKTRSASQVSIASTQSTRTLQNESLARLQIVWGEERLRRRLKCYLNNNTDENVPINLMDYVTNHFKGETEFKTEKIVGRWDLTRFSDSCRLMTVQFLDLHVRPQSSAFSRPPSAVPIRSPPNQTFAKTLGASQLSPQLSIFSNATMDDDTMPINSRRDRQH